MQSSSFFLSLLGALFLLAQAPASAAEPAASVKGTTTIGLRRDARLGAQVDFEGDHAEALYGEMAKAGLAVRKGVRFDAYLGVKVDFEEITGKQVRCDRQYEFSEALNEGMYRYACHMNVSAQGVVSLSNLGKPTDFTAPENSTFTVIRQGASVQGFAVELEEVIQDPSQLEFLAKFLAKIGDESRHVACQRTQGDGLGFSIYKCKFRISVTGVVTRG